MKKLAILICVAVLLLLPAATSQAQAYVTSGPVEFTIRGYTVGIGDYDWKRCKLTFEDLTAIGRVTGNLSGLFTYIEEGKVNLCTRYGTNKGTMTVITEHGKLTIEFEGRTDLINVWGQWELRSGTGDYSGLKGDGTYFGDAGLGSFAVTFSGSFYTNTQN